MSYLLIGAGSYLGRNFFEYLKTKENKVYGISEFSDKEDVFKTDYSLNDLEKIINKVKPNHIFDFKTYLVSSNADYFNKDFNKMTYSTNNIINAYKNSDINNININLISTKLLNFDFKKNHPYLKIKSYQEENYKKIKDNKIRILRIPNVIGPKDINFTRLIPFCFGSYLSNLDINLNSKETSQREYIFLDDLFEKLYNSDYLFEDSVVLSNFEILNLINSSLSSLEKPQLKVSWNNAPETNLIDVNNLKKREVNNDYLNTLFNEITNWYMTNSSYVKTYFGKFIKYENKA